MRDNSSRIGNLIMALVVFSILLISLVGCGVSITQQSAQRAVDNAKISVRLGI